MSKVGVFLVLLFLTACHSSSRQGEGFPYRNSLLPVEDRVKDLVSRMTLEEKISQMQYDAPAVERLGVPACNGWGESLYGLNRAGLATVFPQPIGMAASWNQSLILDVATAVSDEARANHRKLVEGGKGGIYEGLTFGGPIINIFRDPRWGRGQETFGEDPYLAGRLAVNFIKGLQGDDKRYLKLATAAKLYAVHGGPKSARPAIMPISKQDLYETYLPAFEAAVKEGCVQSVMSACSSYEHKACYGSDSLLQNILRDDWDFNGYVISNCGPIADFYQSKNLKEKAQAAATAAGSGTDADCGTTFSHLKEAVERGDITENEIDQTLFRIFETRFRLGAFDHPDSIIWNNLPFEVVRSPKHQELALQAARESIVLLKNENKTLPFSKDIRSIAVIGPNAHYEQALVGNYGSTSLHLVTPLEGIRNKAGHQIKVNHAEGALFADGPAPQTRLLWAEPDPQLEEKALDAARKSDVVVMFMGLSPKSEGEDVALKTKVTAGENPKDIKLPARQENLIRQVCALGKPTVLVLLDGSAVAFKLADKYASAIVEAWHPGELGGTAIADVLFGDYNPAGRLPVTFYKSVNDLPDFEDYSMQNRTYKFFKGEPLYPFGYGLSYTRFAYQNLQLPDTAMVSDTVQIKVEVQNIGDREGDEVVQLYVSDVQASVRIPIRSLQGFQRVHLEPGEKKEIAFTLTPKQFAVVTEGGNFLVEPGTVSISVGGGQPPFSEKFASTTTQVLLDSFYVKGKYMHL